MTLFVAHLSQATPRRVPTLPLTASSCKRRDLRPHRLEEASLGRAGRTAVLPPPPPPPAAARPRVKAPPDSHVHEAVFRAGGAHEAGASAARALLFTPLPPPRTGLGPRSSRMLNTRGGLVKK